MQCIAIRYPHKLKIPQTGFGLQTISTHMGYTVLNESSEAGILTMVLNTLHMRREHNADGDETKTNILRNRREDPFDPFCP
jgi:hypothetical protein